jgi:hypothetical protein
MGKHDQEFAFEIKLLEPVQALCYRKGDDKKNEADFKQMCLL